MRVRHFRAILVGLAFIALMTAQMQAQAVNTAQVHGAITDPTGAAIQGAKIKVTQTNTGMVRTTVSSAEGTFGHSGPGRPPGSSAGARGEEDELATGPVRGVSNVLEDVPERAQLGFEFVSFAEPQRRVRREHVAVGAEHEGRPEAHEREGDFGQLHPGLDRPDAFDVDHPV